MKKIFLLLIVLVFVPFTFSSCDKEEDDGYYGGGRPSTAGDVLLINYNKGTKIAEVDYLNMVRDLSWSLRHAIITFDNGRKVCVPFVSYNFMLEVGDVVYGYSVYKLSPQEAFEIKTSKGTISLEEQLKNIFNPKSEKIGGQRVVEGVIEEIFDMGLRHSWTLNPAATIVPIRTIFVRINGELLYLPLQGFTKDPNFILGEKVRITTSIVCRNKIAKVERI